MKQVINYLTKYLSKPDVPDAVLSEVSAELHSFRLFQPFGSWFKLMKKFRDNKRGCPECGKHCFIPMDIWYNSITGKYRYG